MEDDRPVLAPGGGLLDLVHAGLLEQAGAAHADLVPIDLGLHAQGGGGADVGSGGRLHAVGLRPADDGTGQGVLALRLGRDRESTRLNSSHVATSYAVFGVKAETEDAA